MGLFPSTCRTCGAEFLWFSGDPCGVCERCHDPTAHAAFVGAISPPRIVATTGVRRDWPCRVCGAFGRVFAVGGLYPMELCRGCLMHGLALLEQDRAHDDG